MGDPAIICDTAGDFYFLHLSNPSSGRWIDRIVSQKYITDQQIWTNDTFMGYDSRPDYAQDKEWIAVPCVGPNGEIYVSWAGPVGLVFDKSIDGGITWLTNDIFVNDFEGGWDYRIPNLISCNGLPMTDCDISGGPHNGNIYINWTDQSNGDHNTDVWLAKSSDGGKCFHL